MGIPFTPAGKTLQTSDDRDLLQVTYRPLKTLCTKRMHFEVSFFHQGRGIPLMTYPRFEPLYRLENKI